MLLAPRPEVSAPDLQGAKAPSEYRSHYEENVSSQRLALKVNDSKRASLRRDHHARHTVTKDGGANDVAGLEVSPLIYERAKFNRAEKCYSNSRAEMPTLQRYGAPYLKRPWLSQEHLPEGSRPSLLRSGRRLRDHSAPKNNRSEARNFDIRYWWSSLVTQRGCALVRSSSARFTPFR